MDATSTDLPALSAESVEAMERKLFARISTERGRARRRRRRAWMGGGAAAVVLLLAVAIAPALSSQLAASTAAGSNAEPLAQPDIAVPEDAALAPERGIAQGGPMAEGAAGGATTEAARQIIATATARVEVDDVSAAAAMIAGDAEDRGGYVESMTLDAEAVPTRTTESGTSSSLMMPYPVSGNHITVRVPSDQLEDAIEALDDVGAVSSSTISRQDVTDQAVDLRARIASAEASVARLRQLMAEAESIGDLIAAEEALAERQAALEADQQQLEYLQGQVALSSLSVELVGPQDPVQARPAGFTDGLAAGWNGLLAAVNGVIVAVGFLLPWVGVATLALAVVWGAVTVIRRVRRRSGSAGDD